MRAVWILVAVAVVAVIAWFVIGGQEGEPVADQPAGSEAPASNDTSDAGENATDAVETAIEEVQEALNEAAEEAEAAINEAVETANQAVEDAEERQNTTVADLAGSGEETDPTTDDSDALLAALTVDGFDPEMLKAEVEDSSMNPVARLAAKVLIERAEEDPTQIAAVVEELRKSLKVE